MRRIVLLTLSLLLLPAAALADPGGVDAPNTPLAALDVPLGVLDGELGPGDDQDWYRVTGATNAFRVTAQVANVGSHYLYLRDDAGYWLDARYVGDWWSEDPVATVSVDVPNRGGLRVGIRSYADVGSTYTLTLEEIEGADGAVTGVRVESVDDLPWPLTTDFAPTSGTKRVVTVAVANVANVPFAGRVDVTVAGRAYGVQYVGSRDIALAPGETGQVTFPWSALGAGDVEVTARLVMGDWDAAPRNNVGVAAHYLVAGDVGTGVLLPPAVCTPTLLGNGACAGTGGASVGSLAGVTWAGGSTGQGAWVESCLTGRVHGCSSYEL